MRTAFRAFDRVVQIMIFLCIAGFVTVSFSQVFCRFILNNSIAWAEEMCRYLFVWMVFLGAGIGILHRRHILIDIVPNMIPEGIKKYYTAATDMLILAFTVLLMYYGWIFTQRGMRQFSPAMQIPLGYVYSGIIIGGAVMSINTLRVLLAGLFAAPVESEPEAAPKPEITQEAFNKLLGIETEEKRGENNA